MSETPTQPDATPEEQTEVKQGLEHLSQIAQELYRLDYMPIHHVHFDIDTIIDLNIGALLTLITSEKEYQLVLKGLPAYEASYDRKVMRYFPGLPFTEEQVLKRRNDPAWRDKIALMAPRTALLERLPLILQPLVQNNTMSPEHDNEPIVVHFWSENFPIRMCVQVRICHNVYNARLPVTFRFHTEPLAKAPAEYIDNVGVWFIYDINRFNLLDNINDAMCTRGSMMNKPVFAVKRVQDSCLNLPPKVLEQGFRQTVVGMQLVCNFHFYEHHLCREETA